MRARLRKLAEIARVTVVAPIVTRNRLIPLSTSDGLLEVLHPRWMYVPGTGVLVVLPLFLRLLATSYKLGSGSAFDILDSQFGYPDGIATALVGIVRKIPFSITLRGSELLHGCHPLRRWLMASAFRRASRVIAVSGELARFAIALGASADRVATISNGVDPSVFYSRGPKRGRAKLQIAAEIPLIVTAGHLIELKGHHRVIAALKELRGRGLDARLAIIGGLPGWGVPGFEAHLRRLVSKLGLEEVVQFVGEVDQPVFAELLSAADVFCLASSREGCPNVVIEALACGTPVVATGVGAIHDLIPLDHLGLIVPPNDEAALEDALYCALTARWDRMAISQWAHERSWERVASEVFAQFESVTKTASRNIL